MILVQKMKRATATDRPILFLFEGFTCPGQRSSLSVELHMDL